MGDCLSLKQASAAESRKEFLTQKVNIIKKDAEQEEAHIAVKKNMSKSAEVNEKRAFKFRL